MAIREEGSNIVIDNSVAGSVFPKTEKEIIFPVLIDASKSKDGIQVEGSIYGRSIEMRGQVQVDGPVVSRGDTKLSPEGQGIRLLSGITVNGVLNGLSSFKNNEDSLHNGMDKSSILIRGDIAVNQNLFLSNAIIFGSIRAVNCKLLNCVVLGTVLAQESLTISMSSIGGYSARDITFEGECMMIHALGESSEKPLFVPYENSNGSITTADIRFYPALRDNFGLINKFSQNSTSYPDYSKLEQNTDWVPVNATSNEIIDGQGNELTTKWVLSIGGRIGDFEKIQDSIESLTDMLKCGFEYEHYHPNIKQSAKEKVLGKLNADEKWIFEEVCK